MIHWMNDKRGGQSHNIYVIQDLYGLNDQASGEANDEAPDEANDEASTTPEHASNPCGSKVSEVATHPYKNFNRDFDKNSNTNSNTKDKINTFEKDELLGDQSFKVEMEKESDLQQQQKAEFEKEVMLMHIPTEFVTIMNPFYGNRPEIILERWKSVSVAVKRSCLNMSNTSWETIDEAWKVTVNKFKRGLIKDAKTATTQSEIDKAIGGYFYGVLCDYLLNDFLMANAFGAQTA